MNILAFLLIFLAAGGSSRGPADSLSVYDLRDSRRVALADLIPELLQRRIVIVGEQHTDESHHRAQLRVIQPAGSGAKVAVGLEMFRQDSQGALDRWTAATSARGSSKRSTTTTELSLAGLPAHLRICPRPENSHDRSERLPGRSPAKWRGRGFSPSAKSREAAVGRGLQHR